MQLTDLEERHVNHLKYFSPAEIPQIGEKKFVLVFTPTVV